MGDTQEAPNVRKQLRTISADEFISAHTKSRLQEIADEFKVDVSEAKTKQDMYDAIVAGANLPDQSLRGKSTIDSPVAMVWKYADKLVAAEEGDKRATRSQVVDVCKAQGIAHHTARTQFQSWFTATDRGTKRLTELTLEELPKALHPVEAAAA